MTAPPHFLMCPPDYFDVVYEINPWMNIKRHVDHALAKRQWQDYYDLLTQKLKVKVDLLTPVKGLPDLVFTANGGIVHKRIFVKARFRYRERQGEEPYFEKWFKKKSYIVKKLPAPFSFEGEGDALLMHHDLYTGYHFRSDLEAHDVVSGFFKLPYYALELNDKRFYHLDTCFMPVSDKCALVFLPAFDACSQLILLDSIPDLIQVPLDEALKFACNAVVIGKHVVLPKDTPKTQKALKERGFEVHALDFSEFIKAGGAAKCLALRLS